MGKDTHLVNIYLKIHHKQPLSMDDLRYLAQYDPECFAKTCKNVVYNIPQTKPIMETKSSGPQKIQEKYEQPVWSDEVNIEQILENLKRLEINEFPVSAIEADKVKNLLGSLFMELLFPHNDKESFFSTINERSKSLFDKKV